VIRRAAPQLTTRGWGAVRQRSAGRALTLALSVLVLAMEGCGASNQAALNQARQQGAAAARQQDAINDLQHQVSALESQSGKQAQTTTGAATPSGYPGPAAPSTGDSRIPASGTYSGQAQQRGEPVARNIDFPVTMTFSSAGSSISYPTLGCDGTLHPAGFAGPDRVYTETITSGHCDNGGTWYVKVDSPTQLQALWSLSSVNYTVAAALVR